MPDFSPAKPRPHYTPAMATTDNQPRKRPKQERARVTFDAIVEAAEQLLEVSPLTALTAQAIAERAGVSIGSFYQYFPTKEAVVATVVERDVDIVYAAMEALFRSSIGQPFEHLISVMVQGILSTYGSRLQFYRNVLPEVDRLEREGSIRSVSERASLLILSLLGQAGTRVAVPPERQEIAAFLAARTTNLIAHAAVIERPDLLTNEGFAEELTQMTTAYLMGSPRS